MAATLASVLERCSECSEPLTVVYDVPSEIEGGDVALCLACAIGHGYPID